MLIRDFRFDDSDYQALRILMERIYPQEPTSVEFQHFEDESRGAHIQQSTVELLCYNYCGREDPTVNRALDRTR